MTCVLHSCFSDFGLKMAVETVVDLDVDLSEDDIQRMLDHVNQLDEIRQVFLFPNMCQRRACFFFYLRGQILLVSYRPA